MTEASSPAPTVAGVVAKAVIPWDADLLVSDGSNTKRISCILCSTKILPAHKGVYTQEPQTLKGSDGSDVDEEHFWHVKDMWDFDNIGFSRSQDDNTLRYLTCGACEQGILGLQRNEKRILLCHSRVKYID
eukprot:TRINITY_DN9289_c0_g1_i1.p1 TRINITY_DN9289_c0_g1~~TRINITY_DN9289_c0_g1_i1.p1  ORF type:complete len:131 (+),score=16.87 TRINITY_DN9289_c0_g1_i1:35-427(+)